MAKTLDVYRDWLGIQDADRPLNHYQLLRTKKFEDDIAKIRENYRKMNAHVRKFASGDFAQQSQDLLNELAKAMLCLTDAKRKAEYDATLGRKVQTDGKRRSLEELLLSRGQIDQEKLHKARTYAAAVGVEVRDALIQQKSAPADAIFAAYAESEGLSFLDLPSFEVDQLVAKKVPASIARQNSVAAVMIDDNQLLVACSHLLDPNVEDDLRVRVGLPVRTVICTPAALHEVVERFYTKEAAAAELASGAVNAAPAAASKAGKKTEPDRPLTADEAQQQQTQQRNAALIGFNLGVMISMGIMAFGLGWSNLVTTVPLALVTGAISGGLAWVLSPKFL
jgi:hypothetical protein